MFLENDPLTSVLDLNDDIDVCWCKNSEDLPVRRKR